MTTETQQNKEAPLTEAQPRVERVVRAVRRLAWILLGRHKWKYHNPYDRRCSTCGRHDVAHCHSLETWNKSWWETWDDGDERLHYDSPNVKVSSLPHTTED